VPGPVDTVPPRSRRSYNLADYVTTYNVSTCLQSDGGVICERAMYSPVRDWAHSNAGITETSSRWYFAEGCSLDGFKTWILLQNPSKRKIGGSIDFASDPPCGHVELWFYLNPESRTTIEAAPDMQAVSYAFASDQLYCAERAMYGVSRNPMVTPTEGTPIYPFTRDESIACGHWPAGSLDYPYFGAPRSNGRLHAGIDIYPEAGAGAPVYAIRNGTVIRAEPFYTRYTGEVTYGLLIDHGDFVVNYGEIQPPSLTAGNTVQRGQLIGFISGTKQLHLEMYTPGTTNWAPWYGAQPVNLLDPTGMVLDLYNKKPQ
ncbi:MAG: M23 family metallopeptidase, partial [Actinobacteria bacterium]|nr:M23 family metallopeptidase [Actinomycetota bacterium]